MNKPRNEIQQRKVSPRIRMRSSFAEVPPYLHGTEGKPLDWAAPLIPTFIKRHASKWPARLLFSSTPPISLARSWAKVKPAFLGAGYAHAAAYLITGILLNHVRRILAPWLGSYIFQGPVEHLRLTRSRPDLLLEEALTRPWQSFAVSIAVKALVDLAAATAVDYLAANPGGVVHGKASRPSHSKPRDIARLVYVVWALAAAEYVLDRSAHTLALARACWRLVRGTPAQRTVFCQILRSHMAAAAWALLQAYLYIARGVVPTLRLALVAATRGRPGLLVTVAGAAVSVRWVLQWRSRLFIVLETEGLWVMLGSVALVGVLLLGEWIGGLTDGEKITEDNVGSRSGVLVNVSGVHDGGSKRGRRRQKTPSAAYKAFDVKS
jgi:hypothetical protein